MQNPSRALALQLLRLTAIPKTLKSPNFPRPSAPMASRCRSFSKPAFSILKSAVTKQTAKPSPAFYLPSTRPTVNLSRPSPQLGCLQSLLPFHTAVSSARLTSCLGIDSRSSRSLSQGMLGANPGV